MPQASCAHAEPSLNAQKQRHVCGESSHCGASVPQELPKPSPFVESEYCNALPCLTGVLGSAGGHLHRRGWKQDRAQKHSVRGLDQAGLLLLGPCHTQEKQVTHRTKEQWGTGRLRVSVSLQKQWADSRGSHRHRGQDSTVISAKLCQENLSIFPIQCLWLTNSRHPSVSRGQQGEI